MRQNQLCGVYVIRNLVTGKQYVGSSAKIADRWYEHLYHLRLGEHHSHHLQHAWDKYGEANFEFVILEETDTEHLLDREQYWMSKLDCLAPKHGYNILPRAGSHLGKKLSPEQIASQSGSQSWFAKLDENQVTEIKQRLVRGDTLVAIAKDYGVHLGTISDIRRGATWTHIPCPELTEELKVEICYRNRNLADKSKAKLKNTDVIEIRRLLSEGHHQVTIAAQFGVTRHTIYNIKKRVSWRDLE